MNIVDDTILEENDKRSENRFITRDNDIRFLGKSQCSHCRHKLADRTCRAFVDGIPGAILLNLHDHRNPYPGDGGIRFEEKEAGEPVSEPDPSEKQRIA
jgi:hypothetical protein